MALMSSQALVPLPARADADQRLLALPLSKQPWLDRLFADFDGGPLQELFLGEIGFAQSASKHTVFRDAFDGNGHDFASRRKTANGSYFPLHVVI
jgi:hypothetical protein